MGNSIFSKSIVASAMLLVFSIAKGQSKYYLTDEGKIVDSAGYEKLKISHIKKLRLLSSDKTIKIIIHDSLTLERKSGDSLVYRYDWTSQVLDPAVEFRGFQPADYLDKPFPIASLKTIDRKSITLKDLKGKPTLINFWFTTCKPCIQEIPVLNKMKESLNDSVNFVAISFETAEVVRNFLNDHPFEFTQVVNAERLIESLGINTFPVNIFLDKEGVVRKIENGIPYRKNKEGELVITDGKKFESFLRSLL